MITNSHRDNKPTGRSPSELFRPTIHHLDTRSLLSVCKTPKPRRQLSNWPPAPNESEEPILIGSQDTIITKSRIRISETSAILLTSDLQEPYQGTAFGLKAKQLVKERPTSREHASDFGCAKGAPALLERWAVPE